VRQVADSFARVEVRQLGGIALAWPPASTRESATTDWLPSFTGATSPSS